MYISHSQLMHLRYCDHAWVSFHINTMGPFLFLKFSLFLLVRVASKYRNPRLLQLKHKADLWELYSIQAIKQLHRVGFLLKSNTLGGKPSQFYKVTWLHNQSQFWSNGKSKLFIVHSDTSRLPPVASDNYLKCPSETRKNTRIDLWGLKWEGAFKKGFIDHLDTQIGLIEYIEQFFISWCIYINLLTL